MKPDGIRVRNDLDSNEGQLEMTELMVQGACDPPFNLEHLAALSDPPLVFQHLAEIDWAFTEEETGYLSHDIHPYPAKFIPQIPRNLITRLSLRGELVYDPFGGSGTTALEAILLGRRALSTDLNPLAQIIGTAKSLTLTKEDDDAACDFAEQLLSLSASPRRLESELSQREKDYLPLVPPIPNIEEWFHECAIRELAYLRWRISNLPNEKARLLSIVSFSKSILKASYQDGETRYARKPRQVEIAAVTRIFVSNLSQAIKKVRTLGFALQFRQPAFKTLDLRFACPQDGEISRKTSLIANSVDLIVTSPPYPNTTDYHLYHRFRLFWLGFDPRALGHSEIGSHLRHQKESTGFDDYMKEMTTCIAAMKYVLRPGRYAALVVGDGVFEGHTFNTASSLATAATDLGLEVVGTLDRQIHATKRSFISAARRIRSENILLLRKQPQDLSLTLVKPPYKLWEYEERLRIKEVEQVLGVAPIKRSDGDLQVQVDSMSLDKARKLTFTHGIKATEVSPEATWQAIVENGDALLNRSQRKDPNYATHGIHAYKGKFYPQLAKSLFNLAGLEHNQRVLDPFCGSGTVLLESYLNGLQAFGTDINVLAVKIARVKTEILGVDPYLRDRFISRFEDRLDAVTSSEQWIERFPGNVQTELQSWFPKPVLDKLGRLMHTIEQVSEPRVREFLEILVSSIVRDISQQEPRDLRIRRRASPIEDAPVYELFKQRLQGMRTRLVHFAERSQFAPTDFRPATVIQGDSRIPNFYAGNGIADSSIDAIVTSPPYATALPYIDTDRLSILLLFGLNSGERSQLEASLIGSREINKKRKAAVDDLIDKANFAGIPSGTAQSIIREVRQRNQASVVGFRRDNTAALLYLYFQQMSEVMRNLDKPLKSGGSAYFVIGDNKTTAGSTEVKITSGQVLQELGASIGWDLTDVIPITVTTENRLHAKNSITTNEIVCFRKP